MVSDGGNWPSFFPEFGSMEANRRGCSPHHRVSQVKQVIHLRVGLLGLCVLLGHVGATALWGQAPPIQPWGQAAPGEALQKPFSPFDAAAKATPQSASPVNSNRVFATVANASTANSEAWIASEVTRYQNLGQFQGNVYVTQNFVVQAANANLAQAVGDRAEGYRELLAVQWLGAALPAWPQPCPIVVTVSNQAHGETSFLLPENGYGLPSDWDMKIFGPTDRLLDSVLPHEITHTLFATHFKQRLPRWADEGACTTIEHASEREKIQALLLRFLSPQQRQGIPFNRMFPMRDYPADMLPLYAQGYSVAKFLIAQGGHQQFVQLIERGLQNERTLPVTVAWDQAMRETYGYQDLSDLQLDWLAWVGGGSREEEAIARRQQRGDRLATTEALADNRSVPTDNGVTPASFTAMSNENYYVQQLRAGLNPVAATPRPASSLVTPQPTVAPSSLPTPPQPVSSNRSAAELNHRSDSTILVPTRLR